MDGFQAEDGLIGMSLRDHHLRMTEVAFGPEDRKVVNIAKSETRIPFSFEAIEDRSTIPSIGEDINSLSEASNFGHNKVALSIDSDFVLIKKIPVDATLDEEELRNHINWEVKQLMINQPDHFVIDYELLEHSDRFSQAKQIVVVIVRKVVVDYLREVFAATNLQLQAIDVDVFSAQRVLTDMYDFSGDQKIALIDIRKNNLQFSVIYQGFYLVIEVAYPTDEGIEVSAGKDEHLARIISKELRRIILDNKLGKSVEDMNELFLYGDGVEDGIIEQLSQAHNVNLRRFNPFEKVNLSESLTNSEITNHPESFVVSLGAAI
ncbi:MAG: type IV pilus biogenesis protein PilM, partial [bacterium]